VIANQFSEEPKFGETKNRSHSAECRDPARTKPISESAKTNPISAMQVFSVLLSV